MKKFILILILFMGFYANTEAQYTQTSVSDLNFTEIAIFSTGWQPVNRPGFNYGSGLTFNFMDTRYSGQIFMPCAGLESELYLRGNYLSTWGEWNRIWHSGNIDELKVTDLNLSNYWQSANNGLSFIGNVGIGTSNPEAKLQVSNAVLYHGDLVSARLGNAYNHWTYFGDGNSGRIRGSGEGYLVLESNINGSGNKVIALHGASDIYFSTYNEGNWKQRFFVKNNGNVGIGTISPKSKLDVAGTIRAAEIKVKAQTADFVFEDNYQLRSLVEIEQFVQTNKHLPDIPSAKEMKEDGVGLAEMNKLLLQKVEELTLYTIKQEREIIKLKKGEGDVVKILDQLQQLKNEIQILRK
ncbi:hypothetical protein [Labilibaculum euxinus]